MAKVLYWDGREQDVAPRVKRKGFEVEQLQAIVGGNIEVVVLWGKDRGKILVINEEGHLIDLPVNRKATLLFLQQDESGERMRVPGDYIVGDVLLCDDDEVQ